MARAAGRPSPTTGKKGPFLPGGNCVLSSLRSQATRGTIKRRSLRQPTERVPPETIGVHADADAAQARASTESY